MVQLDSVRMEFPSDANIIIGQSHFIKTVEEVYEAVVGTVPQARFGLAFNESSGPCLKRCEGNDEELRTAAVRNALALAAGHVFVLIIRQAYPLNLLNAIRTVPEVCSIFCATANPVEVIVAASEQGRGIMGVIDGYAPKGWRGPATLPRARSSSERSDTSDRKAALGCAMPAADQRFAARWGGDIPLLSESRRCTQFSG